MILNYNGNAYKSGIYLIYNLYSHKIYIGECKEFKRRWKRGHVQLLSYGKSHNKHMQRDYDKCLKTTNNDNFLEFHVLRIMEGSTQIERIVVEEQFVQFYKNIGFGIYNSPLKNTNKYRNKMSKTKKSFYGTEEGKKLRRKLAKNREGKTYDELYGQEEANLIKNRIRDNKLVEMNRPEVKQHLSDMLLGKSFQERFGEEKASETLEKMSKARKGKYLGSESSRFLIIENIQLLSPSGEIYTRIEGIKEFAEIYGLSKNHLSELLSKKRKSHHGWRLINSE